MGRATRRQEGTSARTPEYSDFTDLEIWDDLGVVVLDRPVTGIAPAKVAPANHVDTVAPEDPAHTLFAIVDHGTEVRMPDSGPQKPTPSPTR